MAVEQLEDRRMLATSGGHTPFYVLGSTLTELNVEVQAFLDSGGPGLTSPDLRNFTTQLPVRLLNGEVVIDAAAAADNATLEQQLVAIGAQVTGAYGHLVSALLPLGAIGSLPGATSINFARPGAGEQGQGVTTTQGDVAMGTDVLRSPPFSLDGTGVRVGVLSDSYNTGQFNPTVAKRPSTTAANDIASGDLPGAGNPSGRTTPVNVVQDLTPFGTDEGRAMLQIVHDVAPGATLSFATAALGQAAFASNIAALAAAGNDVIIDDEFYFLEPFFQDGVVAQAVDAAVTSGASYFALANNHAQNSYDSPFRAGTIFAAGAFPSAAGAPAFAGGTAHDFDPSGATDVMQGFSLAPAQKITITLQWDQPFFTVSGGAGSANDVDVYVLDSTGQVVAGSTNANIGGDPDENFSFTNSAATTQNFSLMIVSAGGPQPGRVKYINFTNGGAAMGAVEFATNSPTAYGHANANLGNSVAAAPYSSTPAFGVAPPQAEAFSSEGGIPILFNTSGAAIPALTRQAPNITAPDRVDTTFFGGDSDGDGFPNFSGTSAAAPHAGALAALLLQQNPGLTPTQVKSILQNTAIDMDDPSTPAFDLGADFKTGFGLVQAVPAILAAAAPDQFESNNTLATATVLGSDPSVAIRNLTITAGDVDFFKVTAHDTGKLVVRILFNHAAGNLDLEIRDANNNLVIPTASGSANGINMEELVIPVVAQQMYFIRVFGVGGAVNAYELEEENFPAPIPTAVLLDPASDTGVFNNDNVTTKTQPQFFVQADVLNFVDQNQNDAADTPPAEIRVLTAAQAAAGNIDGIAVEVRLINTSVPAQLPVVGFADPLSATFPTSYRFTPAAPLPAGVYLVTASTRVFDGKSPRSNGRSLLSPPLWVTIEQTGPPVSFGQNGVDGDGLDAASDTGVATAPATSADRVTHDTTPGFWGFAEAQATVRLYVDVNNNGMVDAGDVQIGQTTAIPYGQNPAFTSGYWHIDSVLDLNNIAGLARDGVRHLLLTAEDYVGNLTAPTPTDGNTNLRLDIFLDTQGPQVTAVTVNNLTAAQYKLFDPKPTTGGPTPLVNSLKIAIHDLPNRLDQTGTINDFLYEALQADVAAAPGNYLLVGDHVGAIAIKTVAVTNDPRTNGNPATASVVLTFFAPLPDDRYTLTIRDDVTDPAGNKLDGESHAAEPQENPTFPSGNGVPGGSFVARFTVDSRPEIATTIPQQINVDINGNFVWDPGNVPVGGDATNVDLTYTMQAAGGAAGATAPGGFGVHDLVFAGKFLRIDANAATAFDQLAVYGNSQDLGGVDRWLIDTNSDGVVNPAVGDFIRVQPNLANFNVAAAIPVAGNFDNNAANGDEIGLYNAGRWALDTNHNFVIDPADTIVNTTLLGIPIVGDFDGDGKDDLAVFNNNTFSFDLANNGFGATDATIVWGFPGVLDRPVAADMDRDGIDDIGLFVPRDNAQIPTATAEWYFLLSNDFAPTAPGTPAAHVAGSIAKLNHPFKPVPFGFDQYAEFGNELALPVVGNFDPPHAATAGLGVAAGLAGDVDGDGDVDGADFLALQRGLGSTGAAASLGDADGNGIVDAADIALWRANVASAVAATASTVASATPAASVIAAAQSSTAVATTSVVAAASSGAPSQPGQVGELNVVHPTTVAVTSSASSVAVGVHRHALRTAAVDQVLADPATQISAAKPLFLSGNGDAGHALVETRPRPSSAGTTESSERLDDAKLRTSRHLTHLAFAAW